MDNDLKNFTIQLILTIAISDYAKESNISISKARDEFIKSGLMMRYMMKKLDYIAKDQIIL